MQTRCILSHGAAKDGDVRVAEKFSHIKEHGMLTIVSVIIIKMVVNSGDPGIVRKPV